ncbi:hypothetical protein A3Q56_01561 [Intoshia linei]|uniref:Uncharacterized protein n=1 Tax=Intoshia linei TaxID=1819745 RepID=A0A177BAK3_9BILA|nr:hypothetical protein A3Q56_01561 [Intoshia linei]
MKKKSSKELNDRSKIGYTKPKGRGYSDVDITHLKIATKGVLKLFNAVEKHQHVVETKINNKKFKKNLKKCGNAIEKSSTNQDQDKNPLWELFQENFLQQANED